MKNVQVIDGANNCTYSIFVLTDEEFKIIFPADGQDIEFIEDVVTRIGDKRTAEILDPVWKRLVKKPDVRGIHGTLFYQLTNKKKYYPAKKDSEMIVKL
jgi:hypothetical protein